MQKFTPEQRRIIQSLMVLAGKDQGQLILHIFEMQDKFTTAMDELGKLFPQVKLAAENIDAIKPIAGKDYATEAERQSIIDEVVKSFPNEEDIVSKVTDLVLTQIPIPQDGKDAVVDVEAIIARVKAETALIKGLDYNDGKDGSPDTPEQIAEKLNTLEDAVDYTVIRGRLTMEDVKKEIKKIPAREVIRMPSGIGSSQVYHDETITGLGNQAEPLHAVQQITVSDTAPSNPKINDLWYDIS